MGLHSYRLWRAGRPVRCQPAGTPEGQRARGAVLDRGCVPSLHPDHVESVPARFRGAVRGSRPQSYTAGSRISHSSAAALCRLCRALNLVFLRDCRAHRGAHRCRLGALGTAVDSARLDISDPRYRDGLLLGVLHARVGRVVVLGPGRECILHALARGHGAASLCPRNGETGCAQSMDDPACDIGFLALPDWHFSRALGRAHVSARVCHRPDARRIYINDPGGVHRW